MFKTVCAAMLLVAVLVSGAALQAQETGRWTSGAAMPSERSEVAVAEVRGKVYVIGGFSGQRELEIYHPATDSWSRGATVPRSLHHTAAVGLNDKLYVVGGYADGWTPNVRPILRQVSGNCGRLPRNSKSMKVFFSS